MGWKDTRQPGLWRGKFAMLPMAGHNKTVVLESSSEFRPGPLLILQRKWKR
jgi:hypothetical protein